MAAPSGQSRSTNGGSDDAAYDASSVSPGSDATEFDRVDAFVTYAIEDREVADEIVISLEKQGLRVRYDRSIPPGAAIDETLSEYIREARTYLFVMSPHSLASRNCLRELDLAMESQKRVIPIRVALVNSSAVPPSIASIMWLDLVDRSAISQSMARLASAVRGDDAGSELGGSLSLSVAAEGGRSPTTFALTAECLATLQVAREICPKTDPGFQLSFTSLLLALTIGDGDTARLVNHYLQQSSVSLTPILEKSKIEPTFMAELQDRAGAVVPASIGEPLIATSSAMAWLQAAVRSAGDGALDTRHLLGSMIYHPAAHASQLEGYGINRESLSGYFLGYITQMHPDELGQWELDHKDAFPKGGGPRPAALPPTLFMRFGPSPHIANDLWTTADSLGYRDYARVLCRFLTHERTEAPLVVGIQAPWGGGKSSLMRMIQEFLDPNQVAKARAAAPTVVDNIVLTLSGFYREATDYFRGRRRSVQPAATDRESRAWTVWFNAWKYESTNQVWAGLADAIICQVADRMTALEKEKFFLRLNLRRLDAGKIRKEVQRRILSTFVATGGKWLVVLVSSLAALALSLSYRHDLHLGLWVLAPGGTVSAAVAGLKILKEWKVAKDRPASIDLPSYLSIPDYGGELGFLHAVESDIRHVLACIPPGKPLIIFIDDLDRCSPTKVAQVVEGVNLFLAGDFSAMFVMGMDSEMVAAALNVAHKDVAACLPREVGVPVGWHFMDKFVQLPFIVPPPTDQSQIRYLNSLYAEERYERGAGTMDESAASEGQPGTDDGASEAPPAEETPVGGAAEAPRATRPVDEIIDEGLTRFSDSEPGVRDFLEKALDYFHGNPRELKRFVNVFRLHHTLWWTLREQGRQVVPLDEVFRWTVFAMKWPDVVRWVYRGRGVHTTQATDSRLKQLEMCAAARRLEDWQAELATAFGITKGDTPWCENRALYEFLHCDIITLAEDERLSSGEGKGLW